MNIWALRNLKMKYKNAQDIFPDELLKEIQKYVEGETIYIHGVQAKKQWGEESGARSYYKQRNNYAKNIHTAFISFF